MMGRLPKSIYLLTMLVIPLTVWVTLMGLLVPGYYGAISVSMRAQAIGQDLVTLVFAVPVTFGALILSFRGSDRGDLLLLGQLAYLVYTYISYAVLVPFNSMWLISVIILSASLGALIVGLTSINAKRIASSYSGWYPRKTIAGYMMFAGGSVAIMWLGGMIIPAMIRGGLPPEVMEESGGNLIIQLLDLGIIVPLSITTGVLLWKNRSIGYVLASVVLVKAMTLVLAVLSMIVFMTRAGTPANAAQIILFLILFLFGLGALVVHLGGLHQDDDE